MFRNRSRLDELTFVSSVNLGFSNEDGRVDSVLVQEYVSGMRVSNADV